MRPPTPLSSYLCSLSIAPLLGVLALACTGGSDAGDPVDPTEDVDAGCDDCGEALTVLASNQHNPTSLALAMGRVYWTNEGTTSGEGSGNVSSCPVDGCPSEGPTVIYENLARPRQLFIRGSKFYLLKAAVGLGNGNLVGFSPMVGDLSGGTFTLDNYLYWSRGATETDAWIVHDSVFYFGIRGREVSNYDFMAGCDMAGCPLDEFGSRGLFYVIEESTGPISAVGGTAQAPIYARAEAASIMIEDGTPHSLFEGEIGVSSFANTADTLFWATGVDPALNPGLEIQNYIASGPLQGGSKTKLAEVEAVRKLYLDGTWLYYATITGDVGRVNIETTEHVVVASEQGDVWDITGDQDYLYWVSRGVGQTGKIVRSRKPD